MRALLETQRLEEFKVSFRNRRVFDKSSVLSVIHKSTALPAALWLSWAGAVGPVGNASRNPTSLQQKLKFRLDSLHRSIPGPRES
jgi:NADPH-dependent 7-cyano-7-deazaguanine reductase QueF